MVRTYHQGHGLLRFRYHHNPHLHHHRHHHRHRRHHIPI